MTTADAEAPIAGTTDTIEPTLDLREWLADPARYEWVGYTIAEYHAWADLVTDRREADQWRDRGWSPTQYNLLWRALARRVEDDPAYWGNPRGQIAERERLLEEWWCSGIPADQVLRYATAGIDPDTARTSRL